jgi:hypothetical protein
MFHSVEMMLRLCSTQLWLAKVSTAPPVTPAPQQTALVISGSQFFIALIAGVLVAFAFQFLLTNLTIATDFSTQVNPLEAKGAGTWSGKLRKIESKAGAWALVTVNIAIFIACFLAVKLTLINSVALGAITGVVIWSAFFLLLLWISSTAIGSIVGSAASAASSSLQGITAVAATALGGGAANARVVNTVEESVAAVRRELSLAVEPSRLQESAQDYISNLQLPQLNLEQIRDDFEKVLSGSQLRSLADSDVLQNVNRQTFVDLVSSRTDLSQQDINQIADQLEAAWHQVLGQPQQTDVQTKLLDFLKSASPQELTSNQLSDKLGQLVDVGADRTQQGNGQGLGKQVLQMGVNTLVGAVLSRTDLSDLDVEKISNQLQQFKEKTTEQAQTVSSQVKEKTPARPFNTVKTDLENYLNSLGPWYLNREGIKQELREILYDPEAAPKMIRRQLEHLNRDDIVKMLEPRQDFTSDRVAKVAERFEEVRQEILGEVRGAQSQEESQNLRSQIENYLRSTGKEELSPEGIERDFKTLLDDPDAGFEQLRDRLSQFDRDTLRQMLKEARQDINDEEVNQIVDRLESTRDRVVSEAQRLQEQAKSKAEEIGQRIEDHLRNTNKEELNPDAIEQELQTLLDDPQAGFSELRERLSQFDRDTLVQLLEQREDLSEEQINGVIDRFFQVRDNILNAPQQLAGKAKEQYDRLIERISEYLRNTDLEELEPEGIRQDLEKLLNDPKQGTLALRDRLSEVDRETLVKLLSQREDLSEERVNQIVDRVQEAIRTIVRAPRRLASRTRETVRDVRSDFEDYLRNTDKEELNPEGIERDLQQLFQHPQQGWQNASDRLSEFDRGTLVALLSQREDISEEEANQIADNIESVRDRVVEQARAIQQRVQSTIDSVFNRIRNYLNSLERPELNYEGIRKDFRELFEDPEAGFEALRDRLSQFDRDTLVAIVSSREDISEADANRTIAQIEGVRDSILNRAERLQEEMQKRVEEIKENAKQQVRETRKAAATAAWWLFGTALTSVGVAAFAGVLAVRGLGLFG